MFLCTRASQHLLVAPQAVMWAAVSGRESAVISVVHLPALSTLRPKPAAWPKVTAAPYICPPALCPSPSVLGTVGVGVSFFGQGRAPGSGSKGGRRARGGGDRGLKGGGFVLHESFFLDYIRLQLSGKIHPEVLRVFLGVGLTAKGSLNLISFKSKT